MKTIFEIPTISDSMTQPGGIALRYHAGNDEFIVHNFNTDRENGMERHYFQGSYFGSGLRAQSFAKALAEFARRAERASGYDLGGAIDIANLGIPQAIHDTLEAGLERRADMFFDNAFGYYTEEDRETFRKEQAAASIWLARQ